MQYSFNLPTKAFSVNAYYYRNRAIKTAEARAWENHILGMLEEHKPLHDLADMWRKSGGEFKIKIVISYPRHIFYNRHGQISAKTFDISNCEKPLLDLILNRFMDVDDRYVVECYSMKRAGVMHNIEIQVELTPP